MLSVSHFPFWCWPVVRYKEPETGRIIARGPDTRQGMPFLSVIPCCSVDIAVKIPIEVVAGLSWVQLVVASIGISVVISDGWLVEVILSCSQALWLNFSGKRGVGINFPEMTEVFIFKKRAGGKARVKGVCWKVSLPNVICYLYSAKPSILQYLTHQKCLWALYLSLSFLLRSTSRPDLDQTEKLDPQWHPHKYRFTPSSSLLDVMQKCLLEQKKVNCVNKETCFIRQSFNPEVYVWSMPVGKLPSFQMFPE